MKKIYYIVDIKKRQKDFSLNKIIEKNSQVLSLTPYSCFLLDESRIEYDTYHSIISIKDFSNKVFESYNELKMIIDVHRDYGYIFKDIAIIKNYEIYLDVLFEFIREKKKMGFKVIYVTDTYMEKDINSFLITSNDTSGVYYCKDIDETVLVQKRDSKFYYFMKFKKSIYKLFYTHGIFNKLFNSTNLYYDHINFKDFWSARPTIAVVENSIEEGYIKFKSEIEKVLFKYGSNFKLLYTNILNKLHKDIVNSTSLSLLPSIPFVYLSNNSDFIKNLLYKNNKIPRVSWQHGSYFHEHIFLDYHEIYTSDINFVINEYTKKLFLEKGATSVYDVGSINFNKKIKNRKKVFDYIYIVNNMNYSWSATYIDSKSASYPMDGYDSYQRHKGVIELFGVHFKDKKICIKMQPSIVEQLLYVPLLELSRAYPNVTIEFFRPLMRLVEESKYIISDYFSSEFLNRELHYKRDIILFSKTATPLLEDYMDDMQKMFILVESITELKTKIENIEYIVQNRERNSDIIEYYSSTKCDTYQVVSDILEKTYKFQYEI